MHTVLLQMLAKGIEIAAIFVRHIESQAFKALLHRTQLECLCSSTSFRDAASRNICDDPRRSVNISRGISRVPNPSSLRHQTARVRGRDLARKLSRKQGRRPRGFSTGEIRGRGGECTSQVQWKETKK